VSLLLQDFVDSGRWNPSSRLYIVPMLSQSVSGGKSWRTGIQEKMGIVSSDYQFLLLGEQGQSSAIRVHHN